MKILQLDLGREWRGGQRQVLYLMRRLAETGGFSTVLAAPRGCPLAARTTAAGLRVRELSGRFEWDPRSILTLRSVILREGIDIIHTHCARSASLGAVLKKCTGAKLVHSRRVSYGLKSGWSLNKYREADAVACVSREIGDIVAQGGVDAAKVQVIHSGIDPTLYAEAAAAPRPESPVFGVIGALTKQKGVGVFLDALAALEKKRPGMNWTAIVAGDGPLMGELRAQCDSLGLSGRVEFAGYRESAVVLPTLTALAVPSVDGEGSSAAIKEAWAAKRPVVCSELPSNLELVQQGDSGMSVPVGDSEALADALAVLAEDDARAELLVKGGAERLESFTDTAMASAYEALYSAL